MLKEIRKEDKMGKLNIISGDYYLHFKNKDAIVNSANKYMVMGSGICQVVYFGAGNELLNYCQTNYNCNMKKKEVRVTPGFNLQADIIHIFAPKYYEEVDPIGELLKAYQEVFNIIIKHKYKNVLICSLGTGVHGYDHDVVAQPVINLLQNFVLNNNVNLYFNLYDDLTKELYLLARDKKSF